MFDGLGFTINNLTINTPGTSVVGLFGLTRDATLRNVGLVGASITGMNTVGGLVASASINTKITNAYVTGSVSGTDQVGGLVGAGTDVIMSNVYATASVSGRDELGGLIGLNSFGNRIDNAYATGSVSGRNRVGGLAGNSLSGGMISNVYATGSVSGNNNVGGLVGYLNGVTLSNVYATGAVSGSNRVGGLVGYNLNSAISNAYWDNETTGQNASSGSPNSSGLTTAQLIAALPSGFGTSTWGNGNNQTTPYLLGMSGNQVFNKNDLPAGTITSVNRPTLYTTVLNVDQLQAMDNKLDGKYVLGNAIDASAATSFKPIGQGSTNGFAGVFDGLGFTVNNLTINTPTAEYVGLFGQTGITSIIRNVGMLGGSITGDGFLGGLVGANYGTLSNVYATGAVTGNGFIGGLVGYNYGTVTNAYATGALTGLSSSGFIGGLVGTNDGTLSNVYATGAASGDAFIGGLVGVNNAGSTIINAYATGAVSGTAFMGGLVGSNDGAITNAYATGAVSGGGFKVGGLVGAGAGTVTNSYWDTETTDQSSSVGGTGLTTAALIAALPSGFGSSVWGNGNNQTTPYLLGLSGNQVFNINDLPVGPITSVNRPNLYNVILNVDQLQAVDNNLAGRYVLGNAIDASAATSFKPIGQSSSFTGVFDGLGFTVSNLIINTPDMDDAGLFGRNSAIVRNVGMAGGSITGRSRVGGLVGYNRSGSTVTNAYATGVVSGSTDVGGLVGVNNSGAILNAYATGAVSGGSAVGGLVGFNTGGSITNAYATGAVSGGSAVGGLVGARSSSTVINGSWDTQTTGQSSSAGGTGKTTAQMQASLPAGYSSSDWGIVDGQSYAYLLSQFAPGATPQVLSGIVYNDGGTTAAGPGITVKGLINGNALVSAQTGGAVQTGANGYYYYLLAPSTLGTGTGVLTNANNYGASNNLNGASFLSNYSGSGAPKLDILANTFNVQTTQANWSTVLGNLATTLGAGATSATALSKTPVAGLANVKIATPNAFDFDTALSVTGDLTTNAGGALKLSAALTATNITLAGSSFNNAVGASALSATGRWLVWSQNPANDTVGGLVYDFKQYNATYGTSTVLGTGDGLLYTLAPTVTAGLTGTVQKTYNKTTDATLAAGNYSVSGALTGDVVTLNNPTSGSYDTVDAGSGKTVTVTGLSIADASDASGADVYGYSLTSTTASAAVGVIDKAQLSTTITASNKVYNGNTDATVSGTLSGTVYSGDVVTLSASGAFRDKNVANGKTVDVTGTLGGAAADNYTLSNNTTTTANITPKDLTISGITAANKVYDGNDVATIDSTAAIFTGLVTNDDVTVSASGMFNNKNVANGKTVTLSSTNGGVDQNNYTITNQSTTTANITPKDLTISGITAGNKIYDGNDVATIDSTGAIFTGLVTNDDVTVSASGTFNNKNVADGKTVTLSNTNGGVDVGNYTITNQSTTTANITPKDLTISGITAANKVYDGNDVATIDSTGAIFTGLVTNDDVTVSATGTFNNKNVADGKTVTLSNTNGGVDQNNYTITNQSTTTANVTPRDLTISGITAANKVYDGNAVATIDATGAIFTGLVTNDDVTVSATGTFNNKNVADNKTVTLSNTNGGVDLNNYTITNQDTTTANITPASLTVTANDASKVVGTANPAFTATVSGLVGTDTEADLGALDLSSPATTFSPVGSYDITGSGLTTSNYAVTYVDGTLTVETGYPIFAAYPDAYPVALVTGKDNTERRYPSPEASGDLLSVKGSGILLPPGVSDEDE